MTRWLPEKKDRRVPTTTDVFLQYHLGYAYVEHWTAEPHHVLNKALICFLLFDI